jgi:hypothetical protein
MISCNSGFHRVALPAKTIGHPLAKEHSCPTEIYIIVAAWALWTLCVQRPLG